MPPGFQLHNYPGACINLADLAALAAEMNTVKVVLPNEALVRRADLILFRNPGRSMRKLLGHYFVVRRALAWVKFLLSYPITMEDISSNETMVAFDVDDFSTHSRLNGGRYSVRTVV